VKELRMHRQELAKTAEVPPVGPKSKESLARAQSVFPDGTARVTIERDPTPRYVQRGVGSYLFDVDGRLFLDLNCNFTTLIHGQAFPPVVEAVTRQLQSGMRDGPDSLGRHCVFSTPVPIAADWRVAARLIPSHRSRS
jgi:4-aminobutyrate aminotransferase-like enzyme